MPRWIRFAMRTASVVGLTAYVLATAVAAQTATGAEVDKTGWWNAVAQGADPVTGTPLPAPTTVPDGAIALSVAGNDADKVAAIGILPDGSPGDVVTRFTMSITEVEDPGANVNADNADFVACPIASFWSGGENRPFDQVPTYDCDVARVTGERDDGVWSFDLAPVGRAWFDTFASLSADGVVLVPTIVVDEDTDPVPFQLAFDVESIEVDFAFEPGADDAGFEFEEPVDSGATGDFGTGGGTPSVFNPPSLGDGSADVEAPPEETTTTTAPPADEPETAAPISTSRPSLLEGIPGGVLLVPLFLVLMFAASFALGPNGEPTVAVRERGVSRALKARARTNALENR